MANSGSGGKAPTVERSLGSIISHLKHNTLKFRETRVTEAGEMKNVVGKVPYDLIPVESMEEFARAMEFGAMRHEKDDWRHGAGMPWTWLIGAALRHSWKLLWGEDIDRDSDLHHGAHLACCGLMLVYYFKYKERYNKDDRFTQKSVKGIKL